MEMPLNIYIFQLTGDHLFIYPSRHIDPAFEDLALEISLYYDFVKKYPPIRIIETLYDQTMVSVDITVKKYMLFFEHLIVRGGTYYQETLPDYLAKSLKDELAFLSNIDLPNIDFVENLVLLKDRTSEEHSKLRVIFSETLAQYRKEKGIRDDLQSYRIGDETYIIDENVLSLIQEVKQEIFGLGLKGEVGVGEGIELEIVEIYPTFLIFLRRLREIVLQYDYDIASRLDISSIEMVYIKNPEFILDDFFYGGHTGIFGIRPAKNTQERISLAVKICGYYETICQKVLNMICESVFDVGLYEADFEWKYERAIYYMDWLVKGSGAVAGSSICPEAKSPSDNTSASA
jgi:hypothetical protein